MPELHKNDVQHHYYQRAHLLLEKLFCPNSLQTKMLPQDLPKGCCLKCLESCYSDMFRFVLVCFELQYYVFERISVFEYEMVSFDNSKYVSICIDMLRCASICFDMQWYALICYKMHGYARICHVMYDKIENNILPHVSLVNGRLYSFETFPGKKRQGSVSSHWMQKLLFSMHDFHLKKNKR